MPVLIQQLVKKGFLKKEEAASLEAEIKDSGRREEEIVLEKEIVSEKILFQLKSKILKIPLKEIFSGDIALELLSLIPEESAKFYKMVPLAKRDNLLEIGMLYPEDLKAQEFLQFLLARQRGIEHKSFLVFPSALQEVLKKYRTLKGEVKKALSQLETELSKEEIGKKPITTSDIERMAEEAPISKAVTVLLRHAVEGGASDIHIEPTRDKIRVRFRTDGVLYSSLFLPLRAHLAVVARIKILANLKIDESRIPQDGGFSVHIGKKYIDFRVSTFPTALGEKVTLRILDPNMGKQTFETLGLSGHNLKVINQAIKNPYGMILITGPTGSGKTTTLYSILNLLNKKEVNIVTIEDPIEYHIDGINQSAVRPEIGYDFANALRHTVRQDPDIIMVGEIRDEETAALATHAALTGHILLSTLHTSNAVGVIPRLIDMGIKPFLIPATLKVVIAQKLVGRLCSHCKKKENPSSEMRDLILKEIQAIPKKNKKDFSLPTSLHIYKAEGCKKCNFKGLSGRIGIFEVLIMNNSLAEIIRKQPSEKALEKEMKNQGLITIRQDGMLKVLEGIISLEEVLRVTVEK